MSSAVHTVVIDVAKRAAVKRRLVVVPRLKAGLVNGERSATRTARYSPDFGERT